jgi:DMSO/TMAO reductase YedYZ molybdopterin-dependent catalytic subunit
VPLHVLLAECGVEPTAVEVVFTGADHGVELGVEQDYQRSLQLAEVLADGAGHDVLLAYEMNGVPLPPQHGFPLRLVVPGWYGMAHVKWLVGIELVDRPFTGFQNDVAYRLRQRPDDPGEPVTRIGPRALTIPPGFPDFLSRSRVVRPGPVVLTGRAWCGTAPVARVQVSVDRGETWDAAELEPPGDHRWAWRGWRRTWQAEPGRYLVGARASTEDGQTQPRDQAWNRGGFANNAVHWVDVACTP